MGEVLDLIRDMANCFFDKIDPEHKCKGTKTKDYAEFLLNNI